MVLGGAVAEPAEQVPAPTPQRAVLSPRANRKAVILLSVRSVVSISPLARFHTSIVPSSLAAAIVSPLEEKVRRLTFLPDAVSVLTGLRVAALIKTIWSL